MYYIYRNDEGKAAYTTEEHPRNFGYIGREDFARAICALMNGDITPAEMLEVMKFADLAKIRSS